MQGVEYKIYKTYKKHAMEDLEIISVQELNYSEIRDSLRILIKKTGDDGINKIRLEHLIIALDEQ